MPRVRPNGTWPTRAPLARVLAPPYTADELRRAARLERALWLLIAFCFGVLAGIVLAGLMSP